MGSIHKDSTVRGSSPGWKYTFAIDDKGGEIYQMQRTKEDLSDAEDRGMVLGGVDLSDAQEKGMVLGGA